MVCSETGFCGNTANVKEFDITTLIKVGEIDNQDVYISEDAEVQSAIIFDNDLSTVAYITFKNEPKGKRIVDFTSLKNGGITTILIMLTTKLYFEFISDTAFFKDWISKIETTNGVYYGFSIFHEHGVSYISNKNRNVIPIREKFTSPHQTLPPMQ